MKALRPKQTMMMTEYLIFTSGEDKCEQFQNKNINFQTHVEPKLHGLALKKKITLTEQLLRQNIIRSHFH